MDEFNYDNEIIELDSSDEENEVEEVEEEKEISKPKKSKKKKKSLKDKWSDLPKKKKLTVIVGLILLVLVIVALVLYFTIFRKEEEKPEIVDPVVLEKDNYRYEHGKLVFLDKSDRELGTYECENKNSERCMVAKSDYTSDKFDRVISVSETGEEIVKGSQIYYDNLVFILDNDEVFLYDINEGKKLLTVKSFKSYGTEKDIVVIEDEKNKFGLIEINSNGYENLIKCTYDELGIINTDLVYLVAKEKDNYYVINSNGEKITGNSSDVITMVNDNYYITKNGSKYNLYTIEDEELMKDNDYISIHDNVIAYVKSNRLYLVNSDLHKLAEDGLRLDSHDYVKKYIYNADNELKETKVAYEITVSDNLVNVKIGDTEKNINLYEAAVSSGLSYVSYFDGILYFYSDEAKENLVGTYKCNNKNDIKSASSTLDKCNIYNESAIYSGIYNNQYIFVMDNASTEDAKIYLYDLKGKKVKGTYKAIDIINKEEMNMDIKHITSAKSFIISQSGAGTNTGNYGVLEISANSVAAKMEFKYKSITNKGDYYLLIKDDVYSIYDSDFKCVSVDFDYLEMFDDYYVGIKDNKLDIYKYGNVEGILSSEIYTNSNDFTFTYDKENKEFKIKIDNTEYRYDLEGYRKW